MLRRVGFAKAIASGIAGAVAWEIAARGLLAAGVPLFDLVRVLGSIALSDATRQGPWWAWWPAGMALHAAVGGIWAVFYAYFFWATFAWRPVTQGAIFSLGPAVLAGLVMVPQLGWMDPLVVRGIRPAPGIFAQAWGWGGPMTVLLGHLLYGVTLGRLYTHPVGHPAAANPPLPRRHAAGRRKAGPGDARPAADDRFMFATGIECSYPTVENGRWRMDQLHDADHYRFWDRDLELVHDLGLRYLRYGPPLHRVWTGPGRYDWSFTDEVAAFMRELGIEPIMDLCHFGLPMWLANFQNPEFPEAFGAYAGAFARRYPWVRFYTPVNEMYVTARRSALDGAWNEQLRSERGFATAVRHLAKASVLAAQAILRERPDAVFVNSESSEFFQACCPGPSITGAADFENQRRFLALDLIYAHPPRPDLRRYLLEQGMTVAEFDWFMGQRLAPRCILGVDYYEWNEKLINSDGRPESLGELFGWYVITRQYFERYRRPLMHTETNVQDAKRAPAWLWRQWHNVQLMRRSGVPVVGFTWYSLVDQVEWDMGLDRPLGHVNPVGLYDLNRDARPVAQAYRQLLDMFGQEALSPGASPGQGTLASILEGEPSCRSSCEPTATCQDQPSAR